jgi:TolB-like protein
MMGEAGNSPFIGKAVSSMLITELSGREGMRVIERFQLQNILQEQRLGLSGRTAEGSAEVGRMVGAQYVIEGQVASDGRELRIDMRAVDTETSEIPLSIKLSDKPNELLSLVVRIADLFVQSVDLDAPSARPATEEIPVRATIEFSRAVDFEDRGNTASAIQHYRNALEIHPNHQAARSALARLEGGSGR